MAEPNGADGAVLEVIEVHLSRPTGRALEAIADYRAEIEAAARKDEREKILDEIGSLQCGPEGLWAVAKLIERLRRESP